MLQFQPVTAGELERCERLQEVVYWVFNTMALKVMDQIRLDAQQQRTQREQQLNLHVNDT